MEAAEKGLCRHLGSWEGATKGSSLSVSDATSRKLGGSDGGFLTVGFRCYMALPTIGFQNQEL